MQNLAGRCWKLEDVQKAVKKYFSADTYKLVIAGDESKVEEQLKNIKGLSRFATTDLEKDN